MAADTPLTVRAIAERYGVTEATVLAWIRSGELRAVNVGRRAGAKKPRWRVTAAALEAFEQIRSAAPIEGTPRRKRRAADRDEGFYFYGPMSAGK